MAAPVVEARSRRRREPDDRFTVRPGFDPDPSSEVREHALDAQPMKSLFTRLWTWWIETRDLHYNSRQLRLRDHEFYDGRQWTPEEEAEMEARGQMPLTYNLLKLMVDWVVGTERRTRIDWNVLPRTEDDVTQAPLKKSLLKYVSDVNKAGWQRSFAFKDAVISGVGWVENCVVSAKNEEPLTSRYQDWRGLWWDAYSRDMMMRDCRFMFRKKWLDLDYAIAMFPERAEALRCSAATLMDPGIELLEDDALMPALFHGTGDALGRAIAVATGRARERVCVWECWYVDPVRVKRFDSVFGDEDELHGVVYDENNAAHKEAEAKAIYSLTEGVTDVMRLAFFCEGGLLSVGDSPYKHGRFPFTPIWAYRDHVDGMPYGTIRQAIDPQRDYNKRRSKSLFLLSVNRLEYEDGYIDEAKEDDVFDEAQRPDGRVRYKKGALNENRVKLTTGADLAQGHMAIMQEDKENILEVSGVTRENVGQSSNAVSGKAILAKQQQGAVSTAELFDNLRLFVQEDGEKELSNIEQFMSMPKKFRILGAEGKQKWLAVNQPVYDPDTDSVRFENDITQHAADFIVDQQDYRETVRMAQSESMFELIGNIAAAAPEVALDLLPLALELSDYPNKAEMVAQIRRRIGVAAPGEELDPEVVAEQERQRAAQDEAAQIERAGAAANVRLTNARAAESEAKATSTTLQGRRNALDTAALVRTAVPLAPAADRLWDGSKPN